jgi:protein TonB
MSAALLSIRESLFTNLCQTKRTDMRARIAQWNQIGGWGFSLFLHGLLLSVIWPVFHHLLAPVHLEPFQWNVTFVELPQQSTPVAPSSNASSANELPQAGEPSEQTQMPSTDDLPSPVPQPMNEFNETIQTSNNVRPKIAIPAPTASAPAHAEAVPPTPSITESTPAIQDILPVQRDATERPQTMVGTTPVATEPSRPIATSVEQEIPPPTPVVADAAMASAPLTSAPPIASNQPSVAQADYGWLQRAVSRRLEELKRSSRPSLDDSSRLKVLVKAVVSSTGELMEAEVVKSSGLNRIDQEAMTLVQRAFPMPLDHALDRQQIVMRIPITYSRD